MIVMNVRMVPAAGVPEVAEFAMDDLGREYFVFFVDCQHAHKLSLICSEKRTVGEVSAVLSGMMKKDCPDCAARDALP